MVYTRKAVQRGSGGKTSKTVATTQTPAAALGKSVHTIRNSAATLVAAQKKVVKLARDHRSATAAVESAQEAVSRTSKYKSASGITAHTKAQAHLKEKEDKLADINRQLEELEGRSSKASESASRAVENAAGVGLREEFVLNSRAAAAAAASEAASAAADNMNYAGLSNSARKRLHNADRRATRIAAKRNHAGLIKKYKKTKKQLKRATSNLAAAGASEALADHADYLRRFADKLHEHIGRKNFSAYAELANYNSNSPTSPNSPSDPNSV